MTAADVVRLALAFAPVCLFLASLVYLDSYKLVSLPRLLRIVIAGAVAGAASYLVSDAFLDIFDYDVVTTLVAPAVEETLKLVPLLFLMRRRRVAFVIDAAICGFAAGTGFALIENLYYLSTLQRPELAFWAVRGFGTAVMHGGTTAIAAMATQALSQERETTRLVAALPGLLVAIVIHSLFNRFLVSPLTSAVLIVAILPPVMVLVFAQSEKHVQAWLGRGFDVDSDLLQAIGSGNFSDSRSGRYLQSLRNHFNGPVVADMLCYLRLGAELSLRAKGILMLREAGLPVHKDSETAAKLQEMRYLKSTIGRTGLLALAPILRRSSRDLWEMQLLEEGG